MGLHGKNLILFQVSTQTSRKITNGSRGPSLSQTPKKKEKKKKEKVANLCSSLIVHRASS